MRGDQGIRDGADTRNPNPDCQDDGKDTLTMGTHGDRKHDFATESKGGQADVTDLHMTGIHANANPMMMDFRVDETPTCAAPTDTCETRDCGGEDWTETRRHRVSKSEMKIWIGREGETGHGRICMIKTWKVEWTHGVGEMGKKNRRRRTYMQDPHSIGRGIDSERALTFALASKFCDHGRSRRQEIRPPKNKNENCPPEKKERRSAPCAGGW